MTMLFFVNKHGQTPKYLIIITNMIDSLGCDHLQPLHYFVKSFHSKVAESRYAIVNFLKI